MKIQGRTPLPVAEPMVAQTPAAPAATPSREIATDGFGSAPPPSSTRAEQTPAAPPPNAGESLAATLPTIDRVTIAHDPEAQRAVAESVVSMRDKIDLRVAELEISVDANRGDAIKRELGAMDGELRTLRATLGPAIAPAELAPRFEPPVTTDPNVLLPAIAALEAKLPTSYSEWGPLSAEIARLKSWLPTPHLGPTRATPPPPNASSAALAAQCQARAAARGVADAKLSLSLAQAIGDPAMIQDKTARLETARAKLKSANATLREAQAQLPADAPPGLRQHPTEPNDPLTEDQKALISEFVELRETYKNLPTQYGDDPAKLYEMRKVVVQKIEECDRALLESNDQDPLKQVETWPESMMMAAKAYALAGRLSADINALLAKD